MLVVGASPTLVRVVRGKSTTSTSMVVGLPG